MKAVPTPPSRGRRSGPVIASGHARIHEIRLNPSRRPERGCHIPFTDHGLWQTRMGTVSRVQGFTKRAGRCAAVRAPGPSMVERALLSRTSAGETGNAQRRAYGTDMGSRSLRSRHALRRTSERATRWVERSPAMFPPTRGKPAPQLFRPVDAWSRTQSPAGGSGPVTTCRPFAGRPTPFREAGPGWADTRGIASLGGFRNPCRVASFAHGSAAGCPGVPWVEVARQRSHVASARRTGSSGFGIGPAKRRSGSVRSRRGARGGPGPLVAAGAIEFLSDFS